MDLSSFNGAGGQGGGQLDWSAWQRSMQALSSASPPGIPSTSSSSSSTTYTCDLVAFESLQKSWVFRYPSHWHQGSNTGAFDWDSYFKGGGLTWGQLTQQMVLLSSFSFSSHQKLFVSRG